MMLINNTHMISFYSGNIYYKKCIYYCTAYYAASVGNLKVLKYANYNKLANNDVLTISYENGHLNCLKYAYYNKYPLDRYTYCNVSNKACLQFIVEHDLKDEDDNGSTCEMAVANKKFKCLIYAHEQGFEWNHRTSSYATHSLRYLKYVHENGCPWNTDTCCEAAINANLECLKYSITNGCPIDDIIISDYNKNICECATYKLHYNDIHSKIYKKALQCLIYAYTCGCPCSQDIIDDYNLTQYPIVGIKLKLNY